jgi:serine/threonine protein kinase
MVVAGTTILDVKSRLAILSSIPDGPHSDRFELLSRLGEGSMGVVFEALDRERKVRVALKTLRFMDAEMLARFKREFRALQDLHHPNLVNLGELIEEGGHWFYTMELVEGVHFLEWVRENGELHLERLR